MLLVKLVHPDTGAEVITGAASAHKYPDHQVADQWDDGPARPAVQEEQSAGKTARKESAD